MEGRCARSAVTTDGRETGRRRSGTSEGRGIEVKPQQRNVRGKGQALQWRGRICAEEAGRRGGAWRHGDESEGTDREVHAEAKKVHEKLRTPAKETQSDTGCQRKGQDAAGGDGNKGEPGNGDIQERNLQGAKRTDQERVSKKLSQA